MQFSTSHGNSLHYTETGPPNGPALLLIHGSTQTAAQDFEVESNTAARFTARGYRVILPDCRGHGRSSAVWHAVPRAVPGNRATRLDYSFSAMAQDLAELLAAIGASPAYIAGHSNGGNIALYMAKEQGAHVRAAVLLAANAYIDEHLRKRVPVGMDPARVERESPDWMNEMIALHDAHQGPGYWRDLLRATVLETITNPDWAAADLRPVNTPCLVVQGENDTVNAPGRHAQVLASWLPNAELWIATGVGHSVHYALPDEFETRVAAFFNGADP